MREAKGRERRAGKARAVPRQHHNKSGETPPPAAMAGIRDGVVFLDAEDIALARLHASLRRAEAIPASTPAVAGGLGRITIRLSKGLLDRTRDRAARDKTAVSEIVARALERFLRGR
jgi:hypothetical protein